VFYHYLTLNSNCNIPCADISSISHSDVSHRRYSLKNRSQISQISLTRTNLRRNGYAPFEIWNTSGILPCNTHIGLSLGRNTLLVSTWKENYSHSFTDCIVATDCLMSVCYCPRLQANLLKEIKCGWYQKLRKHMQAYCSGLKK